MIGYHASHEQFSPSDLLTFTSTAEGAGFEAVMSSDHIAPWSLAQGNSGYCWSWLGAAMQATRIPFGSLAIPIGLRYHPGLVAQAAATLADMFPDRLRWIAAGSGEAMNERPFADAWPPKAERSRRLLEGVTIIRQLWEGATISKRDGFIQAEGLKLWSLPAKLPLIYGAALTAETARWVAGWADGLITARKPLAEMRRIVEAFREGGGEGKPVVLQFQLSWAPSLRNARQQTWQQWRCAALDPQQLADLPSPQAFDDQTRHLELEDLNDEDLCISDNTLNHVEWIRPYIDMGFDEIYLHNRCRNQEAFIACFGSEVLPALCR